MYIYICIVQFLYSCFCFQFWWGAWESLVYVMSYVVVFFAHFRFKEIYLSGMFMNFLIHQIFVRSRIECITFYFLSRSLDSNLVHKSKEFWAPQGLSRFGSDTSLARLFFWKLTVRYCGWLIGASMIGDSKQANSIPGSPCDQSHQIHQTYQQVIHKHNIISTSPSVKETSRPRGACRDQTGTTHFSTGPSTSRAEWTIRKSCKSILNNFLRLKQWTPRKRHHQNIQFIYIWTRDTIDDLKDYTWSMRIFSDPKFQSRQNDITLLLADPIDGWVPRMGGSRPLGTQKMGIRYCRAAPF